MNLSTIFFITGAALIILAAGIFWQGTSESRTFGSREPQIESASSKYAVDLSPRQNSEGGVTVTAAILSTGDKDTIAFDIKMDTHSGSLDYDLKQLTYLMDRAGKTYRPLDWSGGIGGHHVSGVLKFSKPFEKGLTLVIQGVAGVEERVFEW